MLLACCECHLVRKERKTSGLCACNSSMMPNVIKCLGEEARRLGGGSPSHPWRQSCSKAQALPHPQCH